MASGNGRPDGRVLRSGNFHARRIPRKLADRDIRQLSQIDCSRDGLGIRPVCRKKLAGIADVFAMFSPGFMADGRAFQEQADRDLWGKP